MADAHQCGRRLLVLARSVTPSQAASPPSQLLLQDIAPGSVGSAPQHLTVVGDSVLFSAEAPATGRELWRSDGTPAGTWPAAILQEQPQIVDAMLPVAVDGQLHLWVLRNYGVGGAAWTLYRLEGTSLVARTECRNSRSGRTCHLVRPWRMGLVMQIQPVGLRFIEGGTVRDLDLRSLPITSFGTMGATDQFILFAALDPAGAPKGPYPDH